MKQIFVKIKGKTFVKTTFLILIPWLGFFLFLFSYNSYYYGDPFTDNFSEVPGFEHESKVSVFKFDSEGVEEDVIKYLNDGIKVDARTILTRFRELKNLAHNKDF